MYERIFPKAHDENETIKRIYRREKYIFAPLDFLMSLVGTVIISFTIVGLLFKYLFVERNPDVFLALLIGINVVILSLVFYSKYKHYMIRFSKLRKDINGSSIKVYECEPVVAYLINDADEYKGDLIILNTGSHLKEFYYLWTFKEFDSSDVLCRKFLYKEFIHTQEFIKIEKIDHGEIDVVNSDSLLQNSGYNFYSFDESLGFIPSRVHPKLKAFLNIY